jgi:hypothetical protein
MGFGFKKILSKKFEINEEEIFVTGGGSLGHMTKLFYADFNSTIIG